MDLPSDSNGIEGGPIQEETQTIEVVASPFEAELMSDGEVTEVEMDRALAAATSCISSAGFEGANYDLDAELGTYSINVPPQDGAVAGIAEVAVRCEEDFVDAVGELFLQTNGPTPDDIDQALQSQRECLLEELGFSDDGQPLEVLLEAADQSAVETCQR